MPYICNGERIVDESCNIRDTSDTSTCSVGHPDTILPNGLMKYTTETRGAFKTLPPTCKQPTAEQIARARAFEKKQNDLYEANVKKAEQRDDAIEASARADLTGTAVLPGVPPGTYYMMISIRYNNQPVFWDVKVQLNAGSNTVTIDPKNAVLLR